MPTIFVSRAFDLVLLDVRFRPAASFLAQLATILISDLFQSPDDAVRTIRVAAASLHYVTNV